MAHCVEHKATIIFQEEPPIGQSLIFKLLSIKVGPKKRLSCFRKSAGCKFFHHLPARIVECVSEYIFFVSNKKKQMQKQKAKETKENRKIKETNEEREKENVAAVNNICGKSNGIR